jgi:hypothetical protein
LTDPNVAYLEFAALRLQYLNISYGAKIWTWLAESERRVVSIEPYELSNKGPVNLLDGRRP